ncbi:lecithin retinol acyltransferase family protein [Paraclostridium sordellii]|uniref:lecithin retinol acyltransferase family protein n=2 Tax=Paraclostridium sordellii TaxID=1505 RepID=UPI000386452A|nr:MULTISPECIES: lecithin retinol acyltransferase family protein [Paeniclostridium]EPZ56757.1 lecithin retinol acyltransferase family protein [[Clostridium] sordellii VPI 9048] [Paeniclostridium sordellii VPI 9048]MBS6025180.1 lecithin retinol acyltransferase family protein [Paeniclostridium sordellii]MBW4862808.1 lecithin retinol acyltransferase family protein [Paeniclostridium sp.]MBW4875351.1 lecithin retinol acyltransferase family protein [Paeniclostridium sp.]MCH1966584.1 lecithin retinol
MSRAKYGDLIFVDHGLYKHFGIYINDDCVIHYDGKLDDRFLRNMCVRQTGMDRFLAGKDNFKILNLSKNPIPPHEVVNRAKSHLNERNFNLILNNCEHFAYWCKTGSKKSYQVNFFVSFLLLFLLTNNYFELKNY